MNEKYKSVVEKIKPSEDLIAETKRKMQAPEIVEKRASKRSFRFALCAAAAVIIVIVAVFTAIIPDRVLISVANSADFSRESLAKERINDVSMSINLIVEAPYFIGIDQEFADKAYTLSGGDCKLVSIKGYLLDSKVYYANDPNEYKTYGYAVYTVLVLNTYATNLDGLPALSVISVVDYLEKAEDIVNVFKSGNTVDINAYTGVRNNMPTDKLSQKIGVTNAYVAIELLLS